MRSYQMGDLEEMRERKEFRIRFILPTHRWAIGLKGGGYFFFSFFSHVFVGFFAPLGRAKGVRGGGQLTYSDGHHEGIH